MEQKHYENLRQKFTSPDENYVLMHGNYQRVNEVTGVWDNDYVREVYLQATDTLIGKLDGSIQRNPRETDRSKPELAILPPETVIALDKSARPVIDMVDAFWEQLAVEGSEKPEVDFLNIDRIDWLQKMGYTKNEADTSEKKRIDFDAISKDEIARIRAYFVEGVLSEDSWKEDVWKLPTRLDGKRVMVLDEMQNSGATLEIAVGLIRRAIPEAAVVTGDVFWQDATSRVIGGQRQGVTGPVWYDRNSETGRGIGDVSQSYHSHAYELNPSQENLRRKLAGIVLSAPIHNHDTYEHIEDTLYNSLKQDIAYMTYDYADGKIFRRDIERDLNSADMTEQGITVSDSWKYGSKRSESARNTAERKTNLKAV